MSVIKKIIGRLRNRLRFNSSRYYLAKFLEQASTETPDGAMVLDAGAGDGRYSVHFEHAVYEAADICILERNYDKIKYECNLTDIPVEDERFDVIVCTQVLEHIPEPVAVLQELDRVLKPGGTLYISAPLYYPEHEAPYDFFRYTQYGWNHLFGKTSFEIKTINWLEGYLQTLATQLWIACDSLKLTNLKGRGWFALPAVIFARVTFPLLGAIFSRVDSVCKITNIGHCKNYAIVAVKRKQEVVSN